MFDWFLNTSLILFSNIICHAYWSIEESTFSSFVLSLICFYNLGQSIWNKLEKSSKPGQDKKSLMPTFECFLLLLPKFNFWKGRWGLGYVSTQISHSCILLMVLGLTFS